MNSITMENFRNWIKSKSRNRFLRFGFPFLIFIVGGSFGLKEFSQIRYEFSKTEMLRPEELKEFGIKMKKPSEVTLETEFEKIKSIDIEHWENIRGPRPWEEQEEATKK